MCKLLGSSTLALLMGVNVSGAQAPGKPNLQSDPAVQKTDKIPRQTGGEVKPGEQPSGESAQQPAVIAPGQSQPPAQIKPQTATPNLIQPARSDARPDRQDPRALRRDARQSERQGQQPNQANQDFSYDSRQGTAETRRHAQPQRWESNYRGGVANQGDFGAEFDNNQRDRLTISHINQNGHAGRLGLRNGDVVVSVNGRGVRNHNDFNRWVWANPGAPASIIYSRGGHQFVVQTQPNDWQQNDNYANQGAAARGYLGLTFNPNYREVAVVREVMSGSPAEKAGLKAGDMVTVVNGEQIESLDHAVYAIRSQNPGEEFEIQFDRPEHQTAKVALAENQDQQSQQVNEQSDEQNSQEANPQN